MIPNETDPIVTAVYSGLIQPMIDQFAMICPDADPDNAAAVTHNAILAGTSLIRIFRITAQMDAAKALSGPTETSMPTFEYAPTKADTQEMRSQIAAAVAVYLRSMMVGSPPTTPVAPLVLPEEPATPPASDELPSARPASTGQYL